jgi:flagella synthesis protein FlgN
MPTADPVSLLQDEQAALRAFAGLLEQEQQILLGIAVDDLPALTERKNKMIKEILRLSETCQQALGGSPSCELAGVSPVRRQVAQLLERVRQINQTNGALINIRMRQTRLALAALHQAAGGQGLYGADGQCSVPGTGRVLAAG